MTGHFIGLLGFLLTFRSSNTAWLGQSFSKVVLLNLVMVFLKTPQARNKSRMFGEMKLFHKL